METAAEVVAAGAVVGRGGEEVLLVHRPKYDDWSFPKGKLDAGEHVVAAAVREVAEETGLAVRLGPPLSAQRYRIEDGGRQTKRVHYWAARAVGVDDVSTYRRQGEIDSVVWLPVPEAGNRLTHAHDRDTLAEFTRVRGKCVPLVVLRHARARSRKSWSGDDRKRTLADDGEVQAEQLVPLLKAYGVERVLSSTSRRCRQTVAPYAEAAGVNVEETDDLSQEDATPQQVSAQVTRLLDLGEPAVLCTHRPVLPLVFEALAVAERKLQPGSLLVVHHHDGRVVAMEHHDPAAR